jgi:hypothetical protein
MPGKKAKGRAVKVLILLGRIKQWVAHPSRTLRRKPGDVPAFLAKMFALFQSIAEPLYIRVLGPVHSRVAEAVIILAAMMQPHLILDKSVLQMLNRRELFELNVFFGAPG